MIRVFSVRWFASCHLRTHSGVVQAVHQTKGLKIVKRSSTFIFPVSLNTYSSLVDLQGVWEYCHYWMTFPTCFEHRTLEHVASCCLDLSPCERRKPRELFTIYSPDGPFDNAIDHRYLCDYHNIQPPRSLTYVFMLSSV